jgi:hypothetical protein
MKPARTQFSFLQKEDELFGEDGFEKIVNTVAGIEKRLGIYDLAPVHVEDLSVVSKTESAI